MSLQSSLLLETFVRDHGHLLPGDLCGFFERDDHFGGFVGDERFVLVSLDGDDGGADHGLLFGGGSDGLLDGSLTLLHGGEVGDIDELGAAVGDNRHGYGDCRLCLGFKCEDIDGGFFGEDTGGGLVLELLGVGALGIAAVWAGRGFFLAGHVSFMKVALGVSIETELVTRHLLAQTGGGKVHFLLGFFEVLMNKPNVFLVGAFRAGPWGLSYHVLTASENRHGEERCYTGGDFD